MKVLVTGANGYLGKGITKQLLDDGNEVIAASRNTDGLDPRAKTIAADIFTVEDPFAFFDRPDVVLHLAWRDGFNHKSVNHLIDLPKHYLFLEKLAVGGVSRLCIMGTMHEIGYYEGCVDENVPTNPQSLYGISKDALRNAVRELTLAHGIGFQWIRGYYIVGNTSDGNSIFSKIVQNAEKHTHVFPFTSGKNKHDFLDYPEFCLRTAAIVEQDAVCGIINCCSGRPEALGARVERFIAENNLAIQLLYGTYPDRPYDSKEIYGDDTKINEILARKK